MIRSTFHSTEKKFFALGLKVISHRLQVSFLLFQEVGTRGSLDVSMNCSTCNSVVSYSVVLLNVKIVFSALTSTEVLA